MVLFRQALPPYSGPFSVSTLDLELPVVQPLHRSSFSKATLKSTGNPALQLDTVLATIFYPAATGDPRSSSSSTRQTWLQRPVSQTADGYARFLNFGRPWILRALFWIVGARIRLPVQSDVPLADKFSPSTASSDTLVGSDTFPLVIFSHGLSGTRATYRCALYRVSMHRIPCSPRALTATGAAKSPREGSSLPRSSTEMARALCPSCVSRTARSASSTTCDRRSTWSTLLLPAAHHQSRPPGRPAPLTPCQHRTDTPDPRSWPTGTRPQTSLEFRSSAQLPFRLAEISALLHHLRRLNAGEGAAIARENRRRDHGEGTVGRWLEGWKGRIALDGEMVMAGHSFGGATTVRSPTPAGLLGRSPDPTSGHDPQIQVLRAGLSAFPFSRGIALDPWADPIPPAPTRRRSSSVSQLAAAAASTPSGQSDPAASATPDPNGGKTTTEGGDVPLDVRVPLLVINSEAFTLWKAHYKLVRDIVAAVGGGAERYLLTLGASPSFPAPRLCESRGWADANRITRAAVGSIHTSFSDLPLLLSSLPLVPSALSRRTGARVDPLVGLEAVVVACGEFLAPLSGEERKDGRVLRRGIDEGEGEERGEDGKTRLRGEPGSWRVHVAGEGKKKTA